MLITFNKQKFNHKVLWLINLIKKNKCNQFRMVK